MHCVCAYVRFLAVDQLLNVASRHELPLNRSTSFAVEIHPILLADKFLMLSLSQTIQHSYIVCLYLCMCVGFISCFEKALSFSHCLHKSKSLLEIGQFT